MPEDSLKPGWHEGSFQHDGLKRVFLFYNPYNSTIAVMADGKYFVGSMDANGSLIKLVNTKKDKVKYFGEALGKENPQQHLEIARQTLAGGEIPNFIPLLANQARPVKPQIVIGLSSKSLPPSFSI